MPPTEDEMEKQLRELAESTTRKLMDQGRIVEAGWKTYRGAMNPSVPAIQVRETRLAFWHGASFLFQAIMFALEEGDDITAGDESRMAKLDRELSEFERKYRFLLNPDVPQFVCQRCGSISHNPNDIKEHYCGACHDWT